MNIKQSVYTENEGKPVLVLWIEINGRRYLAIIDAEPNLGILRHGLICLGNEFTKVLIPVTVNGMVYRGLTNNRDIFRLAIAFGLEVYYERFKPGVQVVTMPNFDEVRELGDRLEKYALPGAPSWAELTDFTDG